MAKLWMINKATIAAIATAIVVWMGDWNPGMDPNTLNAIEVVIVAALVWLVPNATT